MKRRSFLLALLGIVVGAVGAGLWRARSRLARARRQPEPFGVAAELWGDPASAAVLLAVADGIVPREGESPGAGETDLVARLGAMVARQEPRVRFYRQRWPEFERALREQVAFRGGRPDPEALGPQLERWYASYHAAPRQSPTAFFFEILRQDVLRVYYSSPEGWAALGYTGPPHRAQPHARAPS